MPTRFRVELTHRAQLDIEEIWTFIARDSLTNANRFIRKLERQLQTLRRFPNRCALIPENEVLGTRYHHLIYGRYRTIFRVAENLYMSCESSTERLLDTSMLESSRRWIRKSLGE